MSIRMNKEAADALKELLTSKGIEAKDIRVFVAGFSCSGPQFNLAIDPAKEGDYSVEIDGFTLRAEQKLIDEFGGFEIKHFSDGTNSGIYIEPDIKPQSSCSSCGGGCH